MAGLFRVQLCAVPMNCIATIGVCAANAPPAAATWLTAVLLICVPRASHASPPQAELNSNLHEQVVLLREQKELSEARAEKSGAEVKKLTAKVRRPDHLGCGHSGGQSRCTGRAPSGVRPSSRCGEGYPTIVNCKTSAIEVAYCR